MRRGRRECDTGIAWRCIVERKGKRIGEGVVKEEFLMLLTVVIVVL